MRGACADARTLYQRYLATGPTEDYRARAAERLAEMEACVLAGTSRGDRTTGDGIISEPAPDPREPIVDLTPADPAVGAPPTDPTPGRDTPPPRRGRGKRLAGTVLAAGGVAALGAGAYFSSRARAAAGDVEDACADGCVADEVASLDADGRAAERNATILYASGGVALAAGVALVTWGWLDGRAAPRQVAVVPSRAGALAVAGWRF